MSLVAITPAEFPWLPYARYSFSLGVRAGRRAWLSGHTASTLDPATGRVAVVGDMAEQAETAWDKIERIAETGAFSLADVTRVVEYCTPEGLARHAEAAAVRERRLAGSGAAPAVCVVPVAALLRPAALLEVEVTLGGGNDDTVHLPSLTPLDERGEVIAPGDLGGQVRAVLERAAALLADEGLTLADVVKTVECTMPATRSAYRATGEVRRELLGPAFPAATGVLMPTVPHAKRGAMITLDVIASRSPKQVVNPGWDAYKRLTFSPGVRAGDLVFLSGTTALDWNRGEVVHKGDVAAQAEYVLEQLDLIVKAAGGRGVADLVKTVEFVDPKAMEGYRGVGAVRERVLSRPYPASTGVLVEALLQPDYLIEICSYAAIEA
ncbi:MAG: RidA family protein [Acidimicrobiales bacterium]